MHTENFRPAHPTEDMIGKYELHNKLEMNYAGRKIEVPADGENKESITDKAATVFLLLSPAFKKAPLL